MLCCILCFFCGTIPFRNKEHHDSNLCVFTNPSLRFVYVGYCGVLDHWVYRRKTSNKILLFFSFVCGIWIDVDREPLERHPRTDISDSQQRAGVYHPDSGLRHPRLLSHRHLLHQCQSRRPFHHSPGTRICVLLKRTPAFPASSAVCFLDHLSHGDINH